MELGGGDPRLGGGVVARFAFKGLEEYSMRLAKLGDQTERVAGRAIYAAADVVADAMRQEIDKIPVQNGFVKQGELRTGIPAPAKRGLQESFGITPLEKDSGGFYNVKLGFDGYNSIKTKAHPNGQPNQMIARSVNGGTSFLAPHPFVTTAVRKARKPALQKMEEVLDEETKKIM